MTWGSLADQPLDLAAACVTSLDGLKGRFAVDELAYLALTSKVELPARDRLAFALHQRLASTALVAREWHRTDLAILEPDGVTPRALVEAKRCTPSTSSTRPAATSRSGSRATPASSSRTS